VILRFNNVNAERVAAIVDVAGGSRLWWEGSVIRLGQVMFLLVLAVEGGFGQVPSASLNALVEAERSFAAMSEKDGMKKAFLTFLADEAVIFQPNPVNGKSVWQEREETTARLTWHPTLACVSSSGDLGVTSGPWMYTPEAHLDQPPRYGQFVSVWRKQTDGMWKVVADIGITHDYSSLRDSFTVLAPPVPPKKRRSSLHEKEILLSAERRLSALSSSKGIAAALAHSLADDGRVFRDGMTPLVGRDEALEHIRTSDMKISFHVVFSFLARAYDLAYTYGRYRLAGQNSTAGYFLRVWRRNGSGDWRVIVDVGVKAM
jgi:ketosteroid isomerase-like protein